MPAAPGDAEYDGSIPEIDGFTDLNEIGRGGFSIVYSALQTDFDRRVAIKVLNLSGAEARRLEREARAIGRMADLPNVVQAHQVVSTHDGRPALVMALMSTSLAGLIGSGGPQDPADVRQWASQITRALDEMHRRGVHHRDIKPENVLISAYGDAYLADFGISAGDNSEISSTTMFSMSPPHAPPERLGGDGETHSSGDIYSLASTVYTALAARAPFGTAHDGGVYGLMLRVVNEPLPTDENISPAVHEVLARAMAKNPAERYETAKQLGAALAKALPAPVGEAPTVAPGAMPPPFRGSPAPEGPATGGPSGAQTIIARGPARAVPSPDGPGSPDSASEAAGPRPSRFRRVPLIRVAIGALVVIAVVGAIIFWPASPVAASEVAVGGSHTCALTEDTTVDCWGANWFGQLGSGEPERGPVIGRPEQSGKHGNRQYCYSETDPPEEDEPELCESEEYTHSPSTVEGLSRVTQVVAGYYHTCALLEDTTVRCWGLNAFGQLGDGVDTGEFDPKAWTREPLEVPELTDVVKLSAGYHHTCALMGDGTVRCWGHNWFGQLGDPEVPTGNPEEGTNTDEPAISTSPVAVSGLTAVTDLSAGAYHTCAVLEDGTGRCWGANWAGQLGNPSVNYGNTQPNRSSEPVPIAGKESGDEILMDDLREISAGSDHTCAVRNDNRAWCWGKNDSGQLGTDGQFPDDVSRFPTMVPNLSGIESLTSGDANTCARLGDGRAACWGTTSWGALGENDDATVEDDRTFVPEPTVVKGLSDVELVAIGLDHTCAIVQTGEADMGKIACWGHNNAGALGHDDVPTGDGADAWSDEPTVVKA